MFGVGVATGFSGGVSWLLMVLPTSLAPFNKTPFVRSLSHAKSTATATGAATAALVVVDVKPADVFGDQGGRHRAVHAHGSGGEGVQG